jgi:hypothetical protein
LIIGDGDNQFPTEDAKLFENKATRKVERFLEPGWALPLPTDDEHLIDLAAQLTAAFIGASEMGAAMAQDTPEWTKRYKNEVQAELSRLMLMQNKTDIEGATKKTTTLIERMLAAKSRERGVLDDV